MIQGNISSCSSLWQWRTAVWPKWHPRSRLVMLVVICSRLEYDKSQKLPVSSTKRLHLLEGLFPGYLHAQAFTYHGLYSFTIFGPTTSQPKNHRDLSTYQGFGRRLCIYTVTGHGVSLQPHWEVLSDIATWHQHPGGLE